MIKCGPYVISDLSTVKIKDLHKLRIAFQKYDAELKKDFKRDWFKKRRYDYAFDR